MIKLFLLAIILAGTAAFYFHSYWPIAVFFLLILLIYVLSDAKYKDNKSLFIKDITANTVIFLSIGIICILILIAGGVMSSGPGIPLAFLGFLLFGSGILIGLIAVCVILFILITINSLKMISRPVNKMLFTAFMILIAVALFLFPSGAQKAVDRAKKQEAADIQSFVDRQTEVQKRRIKEEERERNYTFIPLPRKTSAEERAMARLAYDKAGLMYKDAVVYFYAAKGFVEDNKPYLSDLTGNYELEGFRTELTGDSISFYRVIDSADRYRLFFRLPYASQQYTLNSREGLLDKGCSSDEEFVFICAYLSGRKISAGEKGSDGRYSGIYIP